MKSILLLIGAVALLTTTGCVVSEHRGGGYYDRHEYRGHGEYREHSGYRHDPEPGVNVRIHAD
jgi:hypothetical protein